MGNAHPHVRFVLGMFLFVMFRAGSPRLPERLPAGLQLHFGLQDTCRDGVETL